MKSILEVEPYCCCYVCGRYGQLEEHHIYYGRKQRGAAEKTGLKVHLCQLHHGKSKEGVHGGNVGLNGWLKEIAQAAFEGKHTREEFIKLFGENFIGVEKMNRIITGGRLIRDPQIHYINEENPRPVASYTITTDEKADLIKVKAFDRAAEYACRNFRKGQEILIFGRITTGSSTDKAGCKAYTSEVYVTGQELAGRSRSTSNGSEPSGSGFRLIEDGVGSDLPFRM